MAAKVRAEAGLGLGPVPDIFSLFERLSLLYVRYPAGGEAIEGFAARKGGRRIVFTNSSYSRGKEIFTAAHELGHVHFDLAREELILDEQLEPDATDSIEIRANRFAACFLMPADATVGFVVDKVGVEPEDLTAKHVVMVQHYFGVSYAAALIRLRDLKLIGDRAYEQARTYGGYPTLAALTAKCGYGNDLAQPDGGIHVPAESLRKVIELYEHDRIPFGSLAYFTGLIGKSPEDFGLAPPEADDEG